MMHGLDAHASLDSPLHRWEPRCKLIGLVVLIFAFSFIQDLRLLPAMLLTSSVLYYVSCLPARFLLTRLRAPGLFLLVVVVLLPFLVGPTVLFRIGPLAFREEGCLQMLLVVAKFMSVLTTGLVLFGTAPFLTMVNAMRAVGLPPLLADMTLFSYRYIYEIGGDLETMETAMGLRGFRARSPSGRSLRILSSLAGSILVRTYEKSDRVHKAMILRGYGRSVRPRERTQASERDVIALVAVLLLAVGFVVAEIILRRLGG